MTQPLFKLRKSWRGNCITSYVMLQNSVEVIHFGATFGDSQNCQCIIARVTARHRAKLLSVIGIIFNLGRNSFIISLFSLKVTFSVVIHTRYKVILNDGNFLVKLQTGTGISLFGYR